MCRPKSGYTPQCPPLGPNWPAKWLANQNVGFPVTTNTTYNRRNENAGLADTTKLHAEGEGHSANEHVGLADTTKLHAEKEGHSANEHVGFPDTTKTSCWRRSHLANENAGFPDTTKTTCYWRSTTQCWWSITCWDFRFGYFKSHCKHFLGLQIQLLQITPPPQPYNFKHLWGTSDSVASYPTPRLPLTPYWLPQIPRTRNPKQDWNFPWRTLTLQRLP